MRIENQMPKIPANSRIIWKPQKKQAQALSCPAFEMLYGGAAGGGKSDFLLADYLHGVNEWRKHWKGVLFRRSYPELEALVARARDLYLPLGARYNEVHKTFTFPTGSILRMRSISRDADLGEFQGHDYTWVGFDELGNYPTDQAWRFMISRIRSAAGAPCYIRGTANPGGVGHAWIKARFIDGFIPMKIYKIKLDKDTEITRCFIPSTLEDNEELTRNDPAYEARMKLLPTHLYQAMRFGNWDVFAGQVFAEFSRETHVIKPFALPPGQWFKFTSMDWGFAKPFSIGWWAVNADGRMIRYRELYGCDPNEQNVGLRKAATEVAAEAWALSVGEGVDIMVADPAVWAKDDDAPSIAEKFEVAGWKMEKATNDRVNGLSQMHQLMMNKGEDGRPMLLVFENCFAFIRTIPTLLPDQRHPEDIDSSLEDHVYDESRYAAMSQYAKTPISALRKQNGDWNFSSQKKSWNPLR